MGLDNSRLIFYLYLHEVLFCVIICLWAKSCQLSSAPVRTGAALSTYPSAYIGVSAIELNWTLSSIHFGDDYQLRIVFQIGVSNNIPCEALEGILRGLAY